MRTKTVTVFGSSKPTEDDPLYRSAHEIGLTLGKVGFAICNGGYGGTMEASSRGAKEAGGRVIGVTCKVFSREPNPYNDQIIEAKDVFSRLEKLVALGDAYIVLPGGTGTLVELAMVWELRAKRLIDERPIILYGDYWEQVIETTAIERPESRKNIRIVHSIEQLLGDLNSD
jgi:hypothetical protein